MSKQGLGITNEQWKQNRLIWRILRERALERRPPMHAPRNRDLDGIFTCMECDKHANPVMFTLTERNGLQHIAILCVECAIKDPLIRSAVNVALIKKQLEEQTP